MYDALASVYDSFMDKDDYDKWLKFTVKAIGERKRGADLGCGTGKTTIRLKKLGFDVYGLDLSPDMLRQAKMNALAEGLKIDFICADMQTAELKRTQFITAICDCVNYLPDPSRFFDNVFDALEEDGVFVFDISSEYKLINILGNSTYSDTRDDITYIWQNYLDTKKRRVDMELTFFKPFNGSYVKTVERQSQYIHKAQDIIDKLKAAGFAVVKKQGFKNSTSSEEERIFFIANKVKDVKNNQNK